MQGGDKREHESKASGETSSPVSRRSIERRIRRFYAGTEHRMFAICSPGFEQILLSEIINIPGVTRTEVVEGGVEFSGPAQLVYQANLNLRSAERVLLRIDNFLVKSYPELFNRIKRIQWEAVLGANPDISFRVTAAKSRLHHTLRIEETLRDAIQKHYLSTGIKDSLVGENAMPVRVFVRLHQDRCTVSVDTTGEGLHRRGYRSSIGVAPIRENLAAALLLRLNLSSYPVILDPCSGSGTLLLEGASILDRYPPGLNRNFAFQSLPFYSKEAWMYICRHSLARDLEPSRGTEQDIEKFGPSLIGFDIDARAVKAARENADRLPPGRKVHFEQMDALHLKNIWGGRGLLVSNLPYGIRLNKNRSELHEFYKKYNTQIWSEFPGWEFVWIVERADEFFRKIHGVRESIEFENGGVRVVALYGKVANI